MKTKITRKDIGAFTLIELLTVIAILAVVGGIAIATFTNPSRTLKATKLEQDVSQINSAVRMYVSNGGSLDGISSAQEVIDQLKTAADVKGQSQTVGLRGSMVDNRLVAVHESGGELRSRAIWKADLGKFIIETGTSGVREFRLDESLAGIDYGVATRATKLAYNGERGWVWESVDFSQSGGVGPAALPTLGVATLGAAGGINSPNPSQLGQPRISPGPGTYALAEFPMQVTLTDHPDNPSGSTIFYSVATNVWSVYRGPFPVEPGAALMAFASTGDGSWEDSQLVGAAFTTHPVELDIALSIPKDPVTFAEAGGAIEPGNYVPVVPVDPIGVSLLNTGEIPSTYQNSGVFESAWTYDGSDPRGAGSLGGSEFSNGYLGDLIPYGIPAWEGASMLPINVVARSNNPVLVTSSQVASANIGIIKTDLPAPVILSEAELSAGSLVELAKVVDSGDMPVGARIYFTVDGTDPGDDGSGNPIVGTLYTGPFDPALHNGFGSDVTILARVYPPQEHAVWFNVSEAASATVDLQAWEISGESNGWFGSPEGPEGMESNLAGSQTGSHFQWGDPGSWGTGANWMSFYGSQFEDVSPDERFLVGQLSYYNGTISLDSRATAVDFSIELAFDGVTRQFDYSFDLLTTPNTGNAWENADYVWFNDTESAQTVSLYGADYSLNLEFGETSTYGFSSIDQFHVQEAQSASANVYASLVSIGSWW